MNKESTLVEEATYKNFEIGEGARYKTETENMYIEILRTKKGIKVYVLDYENDSFYEIPHYDIPDNHMKLMLYRKFNMENLEK